MDSDLDSVFESKTAQDVWESGGESSQSNLSSVSTGDLALVAAVSTGEE